MRNFLASHWFRRQLLPVPRRSAKPLLCTRLRRRPAAPGRAALPALRARIVARRSLCGRCLAEPPHYDATVAALAYEFPADALVHALKFRGELALAPLLAGILVGASKTPGG